MFEDKYLTTSEIQKLLDIPRITIEVWVRKGLEFSYINKRLRLIQLDVLENYLINNRSNYNCNKTDTWLEKIKNFKKNSPKTT